MSNDISEGIISHWTYHMLLNISYLIRNDIFVYNTLRYSYLSFQPNITLEWTSELDIQAHSVPLWRKKCSWSMNSEPSWFSMGQIY